MGLSTSAICGGVSKSIAAAFEDCINGVMANLDEAVRLSAPKMKVSEAVLLSAFASKCLAFRPASMTDPIGRAKLEKAADYLVKINGMLGKPVGPDFYAT